VANGNGSRQDAGNCRISTSWGPSMPHELKICDVHLCSAFQTDCVLNEPNVSSLPCRTEHRNPFRLIPFPGSDDRFHSKQKLQHIFAFSAWTKGLQGVIAAGGSVARLIFIEPNRNHRMVEQCFHRTQPSVFGGCFAGLKAGLRESEVRSKRSGDDQGIVRVECLRRISDSRSPFVQTNEAATEPRRSLIVFNGILE
jgi:hypothetical protein